MGAAVIPLVASVFIFGPTSNAGASSRFNLTIAQAKGDKICLPHSKIDPSSAPVCWPGSSFVATLPAYARSSNSRFDLCNVAAGVFVIGDVLELPEAFLNPITFYGFTNEVNTEFEVIEACRG
jgi:hypothetical protein